LDEKSNELVRRVENFASSHTQGFVARREGKRKNELISYLRKPFFKEG
jgi:hypothetical protein